MGGQLPNPTYADVSSHESGHVEAVRVRYDDSRVDYETLARRFFEIHDPTQTNGQGPDIGSQYLSVVFYSTDEERTTNEKLIGLLTERGFDVATKLEPASMFWPAEDYHQDYYARSGKQPYCHARVRRFGD
jgi:peptide methionine sulfoxide reductase msrA/msrB